MADELIFDATGVPPATPFEPAPNGEYRVMIVDTEVATTKDKKGKRLKLTLEILDGEYKNKKLFPGINILNPSAKAQEIGQQQLSAVCHAVGVIKMTHSSQLHNKQMLVRVVVKAGGAKKDEAGNIMRDAAGNVITYEPQNEVKAYKKLPAAGAQPPSPSTPAAAAPVPAAAPQASNVPAWARKAS